MTTQYASASYQEVIDLHTETDKVTVLGIHTPVSDAPYSFLQGMFDTYQRYHYDGCSLALVPAARLPADPSQVSYEGGAQPIDPRDLLNPILWHGAHGESLGSVLNQFYSSQSSTTDVDRRFSDSVDMSEVSQTQIGNDAVWQSLYYRALTDNTWKKAHPQQGFRKSGLRPLVYSVGTNVQYANGPYGNLYPLVAHRQNIPQNPDDNNGLSSPAYGGQFGSNYNAANLQYQGAQSLESTTNINVQMGPQRTDINFFTERLHQLGWLDTRVRVMQQSISAATSGDVDADNQIVSDLFEAVEDVQKINYLPRLFMGVILLPPAYKAEQYYRLVLNHRFSFKKFRGLSMRGDHVGNVGPGYAPGYTNLN